MKSFKQLALAAAVLSTSFMAQAQMKSMEDAALSDVTGQDGIAITITTTAKDDKAGRALLEAFQFPFRK